MNPHDNGIPKSYSVFHQDAWFSGIERSMQAMGSAQPVTSDDLIRLQNADIRDCWAVAGNYLRQAMIALSNKTNIYPEELKDDSGCRRMLMKMKAKA